MSDHFDVETGVGWWFSASHRDQAGRLHGHTWEVIVWARGKPDAVGLQQRLQAVIRAWDHTVLEDDLASGEAIAAEILNLMPDCHRAELNRAQERIFARATR